MYENKNEKKTSVFVFVRTRVENMVSSMETVLVEIYTYHPKFMSFRIFERTNLKHARF